MKIIIVSATGTIGSAIAAELEPDHEIIRVGNSRGDLNVDLQSTDSIENLFNDIGEFDCLVSAAGLTKFGNLADLTLEDYHYGLEHKLFGQVKLVLLGRKHINPNGSFTLTSGQLSDYPMVGSSSISMINAGLNGFVRAAALEMEDGIRLNAVSPGWVKETMEAMGMDSSPGTPAAQLAQVYKASIVGSHHGEILDTSNLK